MGIYKFIVPTGNTMGKSKAVQNPTLIRDTVSGTGLGLVKIQERRDPKFSHLIHRTDTHNKKAETCKSKTNMKNAIHSYIYCDIKII